MAWPRPEFGSTKCSSNCSWKVFQFVHQRSTLRAVIVEPLLWRHSLLPAVGIVPVYFTERLQHMDAFFREPRRHLDGFASAVLQLAATVWNSAGRLRESASPIWMGGPRSLARSASTAVRFSPVCLRPVKNSAIFCPAFRRRETALARCRLGVFRDRLLRLWGQSLRCRSQKSRPAWSYRVALANRWLPHPRVLHPYPADRFAASHPR